MRAGVVIDNWKLPIFKKHLDNAGLTYTEYENLTPGTMLLRVEADSVDQVTPVIVAAQEECRRSKLQ